LVDDKEFEMTENVDAKAPAIQVQDIENAVRIIDTAAKRGAFAGSELSSVGLVRDRLAAFVASVPTTQEPPPTTE